MPEQPTIARTFHEVGYQTVAVGKVHVYPQRDRIGFDDVLLAEEGRPQWGVVDDYEIFLGDQGLAGRSFDHGMSNNEYSARPWHLAEDCHVTNWTTRQMARMIRRRDPTRPGFWYLSYTHPHPPLVPLQSYLDMYRDVEPEMPRIGEWAKNPDEVPYRVRLQQLGWHCDSKQEIRAALRAFYALCTHIDHQLRLVIGTLREEGLLDNTIILFTADHGDMLGNHHLWAKRLYYENSANVPMILVGIDGDTRVNHHRVDDRLVGWQDVMPTLLDLAGLEIPSSVDGMSMVGDQQRPHLYGECNEDQTAARMIHDGRFKLIYYPVGNCSQMFDLQEDPHELHDLSTSSQHAEKLGTLTGLLIGELYGSDLDWLKDDKLIGLPDQPCPPVTNRGLSIQRGVHWPPPPVTHPDGSDQKSRLR